MCISHVSCRVQSRIIIKYFGICKYCNYNVVVKIIVIIIRIIKKNNWYFNNYNLSKKLIQTSFRGEVEIKKLISKYFSWLIKPIIIRWGGVVI
jgi:hypothetical protein